MTNEELLVQFHNQDIVTKNAPPHVLESQAEKLTKSLMDAVDEDKSYQSYIFCIIVIIFERNVDEGGISKSWNMAEVICNFLVIKVFSQILVNLELNECLGTVIFDNIGTPFHNNRSGSS